MAGIERFKDKVVGLDTAPLIYLIEDHPTYAGPLGSFFELARLRRVKVITSVVTIAEVLVKAPAGRPNGFGRAVQEHLGTLRRTDDPSCH